MLQLQSFIKWISRLINGFKHELGVSINVTISRVEHSTIDVTKELTHNVRIDAPGCECPVGVAVP